MRRTNGTRGKSSSKGAAQVEQTVEVHSLVGKTIVHENFVCPVVPNHARQVILSLRIHPAECFQFLRSWKRAPSCGTTSGLQQPMFSRAPLSCITYPKEACLISADLMKFRFHPFLGYTWQHTSPSRYRCDRSRCDHYWSHLNVHKKWPSTSLHHLVRHCQFHSCSWLGVCPFGWDCHLTSGTVFL